MSVDPLEVLGAGPGGSFGTGKWAYEESQAAAASECAPCAERSLGEDLLPGLQESGGTLV